MRGWKPATSIQVHRFWVYEAPGGGEVRKLNATSQETTAEARTTPAPTSATARRDRRGPKSAITPSANKIPARVRPCDIGMNAMSCCLQSHAVFSAEMVCPHQSPEQEHRGQFDRDEVGAVERQAHALGRNLRRRLDTEPWTRKDVHDFSGQNRRQNRGTRPNRRS